jgi:hypothetical protein
MLKTLTLLILGLVSPCDLNSILKNLTLSVNKTFQGDRGVIGLNQVTQFGVACIANDLCSISYVLNISSTAANFTDSQYYFGNVSEI